MMNYPVNKTELDRFFRGILQETNLDILIINYKDFYNSFSCKPDKNDYPYPGKTDVIDEDKSVKWNKEDSDEIDNLKSQIEEIEDKMEDNDKNSNDYKTFKKEIDEMNNRINELQEQQDNLPEVFQWFIVNDAGADIIKRYTNDPLYYNNDLDMYLWGVTHYGTSWDYVLTDIELNCGDEAFI